MQKEGEGMWLVVTIAVLIILYLVATHESKEERARRKPTLKDYRYNHYEYKKALRKWEMTQDPVLASLSLRERLERRGHCKQRGYYGDNLSYSVCFACGKSMRDDEKHCAECYSLYQRSPKKPLPKGIPKDKRYSLWLYEQAIIIDSQKGLIPDEQAKRELDEVAGQVRADMAESERIKIQTEEIKRANDRKLQERQTLAERLLTK